MNETTTRYLGLDAHAATVTVAVAEETGPPALYGTVPNQPAAIRKLVAHLGRASQLVAAYEAGPTGYDLYRQLLGLGVQTMVVAPSLTPTRPGDRVKTDARDAISLARLLRSGDLTPVWVPDREHEALRDLVRAREDAKVHVLQTRHHLSKFLLRHGIRPPAGCANWTLRYYSWVRQLRFAVVAERLTFEDYLAAEQAARDRMRRLEAAIRECLTQSRLLPLVTGLQCLRGIAFLSAVIIAVEVGDFRRFRAAPSFMAYTGLVPSEHSSGEARRRGHITHTGNAHLRHVLIQAAHNARYRPSHRADFRRRLEGGPPDLIELGLRAQARLHDRYWHLQRRLGSAKAVTAVARELAGFAWAVGCRMESSACP
jgi:transposase